MEVQRVEYYVSMYDMYVVCMYVCINVYLNEWGMYIVCIYVCVSLCMYE